MTHTTKKTGPGGRELEVVFILEDEDINLLIATDSFYQIGIDPVVVETRNAREGIEAYLKLIEDRRPDIALIDIKLDDSAFDGIEFIRRINTDHGNSVLIGVLSYSADPADIERAKSVGACFYVEKGGGASFIRRMKRLVQYYFIEGGKDFLLLLNND